MNYVGRFAPSPTGPLHKGSILAALASYLDARAHQGRWLLRIEDIDEPRCQPIHARRMMQCLQTLGMQWDGEVEWQSKRHRRYQVVFDELQQQGLIYPCACTRKQLRTHARPGEDAVYQGTCRNGLQAGQQPRAWRLLINDDTVQFKDRLLGWQSQQPRNQCGDVVIRRADGLFAYQFVVVIDDMDQAVTDIVRGADLLSSTGRQILIQRALKPCQLQYMHVPLILGQDGRKLSKQNGANEVPWEQHAQDVLNDALRMLGQNQQTGDINSILRGAIRDWSPKKIPKSS